MAGNFIPCISTAAASGKISEKLKIYSRAGFRAVEIEVEERPSPAEMREIKAVLSDTGLAIANTAKLRGWFELDGGLMGVRDDISAIMDECKRRFETTCMLGGAYIVASPSYGNRGHFAEIEAGVERYRQIARIGAEYNVAPTFEFMGQTQQINTLEKALDFMRRVDMPDLKMIIDSYHLWRGGGCMEDFARVDPKSLSSLHLADNDPCIDRPVHCDRERLYPGEGNLQLSRFMQIAREKGYVGPVSLGVYKYASCSAEVVAANGMAALKPFLEERHL